MAFTERVNQTALPLTEVTESGVTFKTGQPVTFGFLRNTESSKKFKIPAERFQQNIEPAGKYMLHNTNPEFAARYEWEFGNTTFQNPLVLRFNRGSDLAYDDGSWKAALNKFYGKTGKALTNALIKDGYDGIVTVHDGSTREIVKIGR